MRILNRPMFRYGGPIKEGVMHGMRNNYQSGQLVRPGPGRPGYQGKIPKSKLGAAGWLGSKIPFLKQPIQKLSTSTKDIIPRAGQYFKNLFGSTAQAPYTKVIQRQSPGGKILGLTPRYRPGGPGPNVGDVGKVWTPKGWVARDPLYRVGSAAWQGKGVLGKPIKWAAGKIGTPTGVLTLGGVTYSLLKPDGTPKTIEELKVETGANEKELNTAAKVIDPDKAKKLAKEKQNERMKSYLDMMGYDRSKKTAMSDALIDASALVQDATTEAGSIKHADWGKLINKAIQTTSKRYDKPEQIREAVGLMATKAAIEKDMTAEEDALKKIAAELNIKIGQKTLAGASFEDIVSDRMIKSDMLKGNDLASLLRIKKGIDAKVISTAKMDAGQDALTYAKKIIADKKAAGTPYPPGHYIISDRIVKVDEEGNMNKVL